MRPRLARDTPPGEPWALASAGHLLVVTWDIAESASAAHAVKIALSRSRRREAVVVFLTDTAVSVPLGLPQRTAIERMLASGARVVIDAQLVGVAPDLADIPGVEMGTDDDLADFLFTRGIDARWI